MELTSICVAGTMTSAPKPWPMRSDADGGGALAHEPKGDQRVVADETERALAQRGDDAVGKIEADEGIGKG